MALAVAPDRHSLATMASSRTDGRTARRERNRTAALQATQDLFVEQRRLPSIEDVADRAEVSLRSLYRYFDDSRQMHLEALARHTAGNEDHYLLAGVGEGSLDERVAAFVEHRLRLYERVGATIRAALTVTAEMPLIDELVRTRKAALREQTARHFAAELGALPGRAATEALDTVELLGQFEAIDQLRRELGRSPAATRRTLVRAIRAVLGES